MSTTTDTSLNGGALVLSRESGPSNAACQPSRHPQSPSYRFARPDEAGCRHLLVLLLAWLLWWVIVACHPSQRLPLTDDGGRGGSVCLESHHRVVDIVLLCVGCTNNKYLLVPNVKEYRVR